MASLRSAKEAGLELQPEAELGGMSSGDWQEEGGDWLPPRHPVAEPPTPEEAPPFLLETVVACLVGAITVMLSSLLTPPATLKIVTALGPGRLIFTASAMYCILYLVDYMAELSSANPTLKVAISLKVRLGGQGWGSWGSWGWSAGASPATTPPRPSIPPYPALSNQPAPPIRSGAHYYSPRATLP